MKQTLDLLLSTLKKLEKTSKTDDITKLEEEVVLLIKDLTSSIAENKYSKDDGDLIQIGNIKIKVLHTPRKLFYLVETSSVHDINEKIRLKKISLFI